MKPDLDNRDLQQNERAFQSYVDQIIENVRNSNRIYKIKGDLVNIGYQALMHHRKDQDVAYDAFKDEKSTFTFLEKSSNNDDWKDFASFDEVQKSVDVYFSLQSSKLDETQKCYKEYLVKNELNFCTLAMY